MEALERLVPGKEMEVGETAYRVDGHNMVTIRSKLQKNTKTSIN